MYANPDVLTDTETVAKNLNGSSIKIVEVDYDPENAYRQGHLPGATLIWWKRDINDPITRDIVSKTQFEDLMSRNGITPESEVVLYGDFNNWFAAFVFWIFKYYGHDKVKIMNGGRKKWEIEKRTYTKDEPQIQKTKYTSKPPNEGVRAYLFDVRRALDKKDTVLVDVRSPKEFSGEITAPPEYPGTRAERRPHPDCKKHPLGYRSKRHRRHLQNRRGAETELRVKGNNPRQGRDLLLQDRGEIIPQLVCPQISPGIPAGEKLRRLVDRMG